MEFMGNWWIKGEIGGVKWKLVEFRGNWWSKGEIGGVKGEINGV